MIEPKKITRAIYAALRRWGRGIKRLFRGFLRLPAKRRLILGAGALAAVAALVGVCALIFGGDRAGAKAAALPESDPAVLLDGAAAYVEITPSPTPVPTPAPTPVPTPTPTPDPTLKRGSQGERVTELQVRLISLGYLEIDEPTDLYGPATENAVSMFQRQVNFTDTMDVELDVDGVAGIRTLDLIYGESAPKYVVKYGMEGGDIDDLQTQLQDLGYMSVSTGYYGDTTVAALKEFQDRNGLSADGMCGEKTFSLLYSPDARESASKSQQARTKANIDEMISAAKEQLGDRYVLGARGPDKFDCSGLVYYCLKQAGSNRNRLNAAGYARVSDWEKIGDIDDLKKGDLILFYSDDFSKIGHIGIVINNSGEMIDASSSNGKVVRRDYDTSYWRKHFYCGRRPW